MALRIISTLILVMYIVIKIGTYLISFSETNKIYEGKMNMIETLRFLISLMFSIFLTVSIWLI